VPDGLVLLAADHRARGILTVERYADYLGALRAALPFCDGILASAQPLADLVAGGDVTSTQRTYLSLNRTGLAGSVFELDDRLVATAERAAADGYHGVKIMTRIDRGDPHTAGALELLGRVLEDARRAGLDALVEPLTWTGGPGGHIDRSVAGITAAAVIAHDLGAPLLKVPVPTEAPGSARVDAVRRVTESVGVPVLFLGGPHTGDRDALLAEVADAVAGGGAGLAIGRTIYQDTDPAGIAKLVAELVHAGR
jgi:DhnA family fructose-bisphosphate aldolase class Ia